MESIINLLTKPVGAVIRWSGRPRFRLTTNIDPVREGEYFLRLKVENLGRRPALKCIGRLIEIRDGQGSPVDLSQLDFCWERHNQANPPHPEDILRRPFAKHLDIARYSKDTPQIVGLRVDAENQQLALGKYNPERLLEIPVGTYYVLVSVYTEDGFANTKWYVLEWSGSEYTIVEGRPPTPKK